MTPADALRFMRVLRAHVGDSRDHLDEYLQWLGGTVSATSPHAERLGVEKDAALTLFRAANLDPTVLTLWDEPHDENAGFLSGLRSDIGSRVETASSGSRRIARSGVLEGAAASDPGRRQRARPGLPERESRAFGAAGLHPFPRDLGQTVLEDSLILADMRSVPGMVESDSPWTEWRRFQNGAGTQVLHLMYANRNNVERASGADLVYFNPDHESFVLVQYKKLSNKNRSSWAYRPEGSFEKELANLVRLDAWAIAGSEREDRIFPSPSFFKFCQQTPVLPAGTSLLEGMYLPARHVHQEIVRQRRSGKPPRIDRGSPKRHFSNSMFIELLKQGHIGCSGDASVLLADALRAAQEGDRSLLLGIHLES